jgi:hypothetical protein
MDNEEARAGLGGWIDGSPGRLRFDLNFSGRMAKGFALHAKKKRLAQICTYTATLRVSRMQVNATHWVAMMSGSEPLLQCVASSLSTLLVCIACPCCCLTFTRAHTGPASGRCPFQSYCCLLSHLIVWSWEIRYSTNTWWCECWTRKSRHEITAGSHCVLQNIHFLVSVSPEKLSILLSCSWSRYNNRARGMLNLHISYRVLWPEIG